VTEPLPGLDPGRLPVQEDVNGWVDPIALLERAHGTRHPVLLHSALAGHPAARFSIFACDPLCTLSIAGNRLEWVSGAGGEAGRTIRDDVDPFDLLRELTPSRRIRNAAGLPFLGGAIGVCRMPGSAFTMPRFCSTTTKAA
jgi:anthranilate/para-aminobenzoate synthase component I